MIEALIAKCGVAVFRYAAVAFAVVASVLAFAFHEQSKGAVKAVARIEKATTNVIKKGDAAAVRSRDPSPGRMRDPYTLD